MYTSTRCRAERVDSPTGRHSGPDGGHTVTDRPVRAAETRITSPDREPGLPPGGLVDPATINQRDADAVGQAALTDMYRHDTSIDASPTDALRRSVPWLSPRYQKAVTAAQPHGGGSSWTSWAAHNAYTQVTATLEHDYGQPADTTTVASRVYAVTVTPTGRDHWRGAPATTTVFLTLTRADARHPWRVDALTTG